MDRPLDQTDWRILAELQADGRLSYNELARRVQLSAPAVADQVRRLEDQKIIDGYQARVDPARAGLPFTAFIQMRCVLGRCLLKTTTAEDFPEIIEIHRLSGSSCTMLKVRASSMAHFEGLVERLGEHAELNTHVVLSTPYEGRPVVQAAAQHRTVSQSQGWSR